MTRDRDIEQLLDTWFADGPMHVSDRAFDEAVGSVYRQRQRPAWRLPLWRFPAMSAPLKVALLGAALLAVILGGAVFLSGGGTGPGPTPSPTPSPTPIPTPSPTPAPTVATMNRGALDPGTYVTRPVVGDAITWQVTVPAGWTNPGNWYLYPTALHGPSGKDESGTLVGITIAFVNRPQVFVDSCDFSTMTDTSTVAELVAAIQAKDDWVVSTPLDVTISGFAGQRIDVVLPTNALCGADNRLAIGSTGTNDGFYQQGPSQQLRLWILDAGDRIVLLAHESFPASPEDKVAEAQTVLESSIIMP